MKRIYVAVVAAALVWGGSLVAQAVPKAQDELIKQLGGDGAPSAKTGTELEAAYARVMPQLLANPEGDDTALQRIAFRASRPGAEVERAALAKVLAARLTGQTSGAVRVVVLRHLQRIGRDEVVAGIAEQFNDSDARVRDSARRALANIPTKSAAEAIRAAIDKAEDSAWRGALVSALAFRRDRADAPVFAKEAASSEEAVRIPAMAALARTGDASAVAVLGAARETGSDAAKAAAHDAYLALADRLAASGEREVAAKLYREYVASPTRFRYAGIVGLGAVGTAEDVRKMIDLLGDPDPQARGAALGVLARRREAAIADEIAARLAKADPTARPWLLRALVEQGDPRAKQAMLSAAMDGNAIVRLAAIAGLANVGDAAAVPLLLKSATTTGEEQVAARNALEVLAGKGVDEKLLEKTMAADAGGVPEQRVEAIRALGLRRTGAAVGRLFELAEDPDKNVRSEALRSVALVAEFDQLPHAMGLLMKAKEDADREQAARAVVAIARKSDDADARSAAVLEELAKAQGTTKATLLNVAGQLGGERALAAIREAVKSEDEKTHETGVRALASWPDAAPMQDLMALAKGEKNNTLAILSLRGYVRVIGVPSERKPEETVKLYQEAMEIAKRPEEKKMVLGGLGEVKHPQAMEAVAAYLSDESLAGEACAAAVKIGRDIWEKNKELTKGTMKKVIEVSKSEGQKRGAKEVLEKIEPPGKAEEKEAPKVGQEGSAGK